MVENKQAMAVQDVGAALERVVVAGDLKELTPAQRVTYYNRVCDSLGLNPLTQPFTFITLNSKLTLYATRGATDQLRKVHNVSCTVVSREVQGEVYVVTAHTEMPNGRTDESIGAVAIGSLKGDALANALMKAETKAKRRATLSIVGLGWLDESEVDSVPGARVLTNAEAMAEPAVPPSCSDCGQAIGKIPQRDGTTMSAEEAAKRTTAKFGRALCLRCAKAQDARDQAVEAAQPRVEEQAF